MVGMTGFSAWSRVSRLFQRKTDLPEPPPEGQALHLQVASPEFLRDCLGEEGYDRMLRRIWERALSLSPKAELLTAQGALLCPIPTKDSHEARHMAKHLLARVQQPLTIAGITLTPDLVVDLMDRPSPEHPTLMSQCDIEVWFQPQIDCDCGAVTGFEALPRFRHPEQGYLLPGVFLPQLNGAERARLSLEVLRQAGAALRQWDAGGWGIDTVSVNFSEQELVDPNLPDLTLWEMDRLDLHPSRLVVEVLETVAPPATEPPTAQDEAIAANLRRLAAAGCRIDLDDFGTGFSSLGAIRHFAPQRLKIDRRFITDCDKDIRQQHMILAILSLADHLGLTTLAEGVETADEQAFLTQIGCHQLQGYAIARPMPFAQTIPFLQERRKLLDGLPQLFRRTG